MSNPVNNPGSRSALSEAYIREWEDETYTDLVDKGTVEELTLLQFFDTHPNIMVDDGEGGYTFGSDKDAFMTFLKGHVPAELEHEIMEELEAMFEKQDRTSDPDAKQAIADEALKDIFSSVIKSYELTAKRELKFNQAVVGGGSNPPYNPQGGVNNPYNYQVGSSPMMDGIFGSDANVLVIMMYVFAEMTILSGDIMKTDAAQMSRNTKASSFINRYKSAMASFQGIDMPVKFTSTEIPWLDGKIIDDTLPKTYDYEITDMADLFRLAYGTDNDGEQWAAGQTYKSALDPLFTELKKDFPADMDSIISANWRDENDDSTLSAEFGNVFSKYGQEVNAQISFINPNIAQITLWQKDEWGGPVLDSKTNEFIGNNIDNATLGISEASTISATLQANAQFHQNSYNQNVNLLMKPDQIAETIRRIIFGT